MCDDKWRAEFQEHRHSNRDRTWLVEGQDEDSSLWKFWLHQSMSRKANKVSQTEFQTLQEKPQEVAEVLSYS